MNKVKGNININIIDPPGFGPSKKDTIEDLALLTGSKVINEELGDDLELIEPSSLGGVEKAVTDDNSTVLTLYNTNDNVKERIKDINNKIDLEISKIFGLIAVVLASVNIFGGFIVTYRMLSMFKKKRKKKN